jgi:hypothetical protein
VSYDFTDRSAPAFGYDGENIAPEQPLRFGREIFVKLSYVPAV